MNREETSMKPLREIENIIEKAMKKVGGRSENDLCKYIPMASGGYIHHFTLRKMKHKQPQELSTLIEKFIIQSDKPHAVPPKQRAARGSRKRREQSQFSRVQLQRLLEIAKMVGDQEIVSILSPKRPLAVCKRELISSIKHSRLEPELWHAYVDAVNAEHPVGATAAKF